MDAVLRLQGSTDMEAIHVIKKPGGTLKARACHLPGGSCFTLLRLREQLWS